MTPSQIEDSIERIPWSGCWIWNKGTSNGYGGCRVGNTVVRAHRFVYESLVGPIALGMDLLHKCDVKLCVNPEHMYQGTDYDNAQDRIDRNPVYHMPLPAFCPQNHAMVIANSGYYNGVRYCKECKRIRYRVWYAKTGRPNR